jgi:hypothetical protein
VSPAIPEGNRLTIADYSNFIEARNGQISADVERDSRTSVPLGAGQSISLSPDNLLRGRAPFTSFARYSPRCPSFIALQDDRRAIADSELAIAASGWAVLFWRLIQREMLTRISGLALFKALLETRQACVPQNLFLFCQECSQEFVRLDDVATFSMATH